MVTLLTQTINLAQKTNFGFMLTIDENYQNLEKKSQTFQLRGFCISEVNPDGNLKIYFQKGIGITLTKKIIDLYIHTIIQKRQGYITDKIGHLSIFINFFDKKPENKLVVMYIDKEDNPMNYRAMYKISKKIYNYLSNGIGNLDIKNICENIIKIPKAKGIVGVFIIDKAGFLYFSKINENKPNMAINNFQIAGFISAILIYSQDFIGNQEYGLQLEDINLGDYQIILKTKSDVIFAYIVEMQNSTENIKRYMQLLVEEFLDTYYSGYVKNFKGDLTPFHDFEKIFDQYFEI